MGCVAEEIDVNALFPDYRRATARVIEGESVATVSLYCGCHPPVYLRISIDSIHDVLFKLRRAQNLTTNA